MNTTLVTGGSGMLGQALKKILPNAKYPDRIACDLERRVATEGCWNFMRPTSVIHLAGKVGGIKGNNDNQYDFCYQNLRLNSNVVDACRIQKVDYILAMSSVCVYPRVAPSYPITENMLHQGEPEPTNRAYAFSKRLMQVQLEALAQQYGQKFCVLYSTNLYGPNDRFNEQGAHVIPDLISKLHKAKVTNQPVVELYGTGVSLRQFTYVEDMAQLIKAVFDRKLCGSFNAGNPEQVSIKELVELLIPIIGYQGQIVWNGQLDGQYKREVSVEKLQGELPEFFGYFKWTPLKEGLEKTYRWYLDKCEELDYVSNTVFG